MKIAIGMPTVGSSVCVHTLSSIVSGCGYLASKGIPFVFINVDRSEIVAARNQIGKVFLEQHDTFTHLLFVDYDMRFQPQALRRLIESGKPLVGCACPQRKWDLEAADRLFRERVDDPNLDLAKALAVTAEFNIRQKEIGGKAQYQIFNGMARVQGIGMGVTLIERRVFEELIQSGTVPSFKDSQPSQDEMNSVTHGFFNPIILENGNTLSEDYSFCERWQEACGGEVWCNIQDPIGHYGSHGFYGSYLDVLLSTGERHDPTAQ